MESERRKNQESFEKQEPKNFFEAIGMTELERKLTPQTPWIYFSMELYGQGIRGGGGLGILAADTLEAFSKLNLPSIFITPLYPQERKKRQEGLGGEIEFENINPEEKGFKPADFTIKIRTIFNGQETETDLEVFQKDCGAAKLLTLTEKGLGYLYQGEKDSDHRLYQEVVLGFGGFKILKHLQVEPSVLQINESAAVFGALAFLDNLMTQGKSFEEALEETRKRTIYTNHTLVQAAEASFSKEQFEKLVFTNISNPEIKAWVQNLFANGYIKLSSLAMSLAGKRNGVSRLHAQESNKTFRGPAGENPEFSAITNGINIDRWADQELLNYYRQIGVFGKFDLLAQDFEGKIDDLDKNFLMENKNRNREKLRQALKEYKDQYGQSIEIPEDALIFVWKRRFASYKRPGLLFKNPEELSKVLEENNAYLIMAGEVHPADEGMKLELKRLLKIVDENPVLKQRVKFLGYYDAQIAKALSLGADASINTPTVKNEKGERISTEACGTSWEKDILGNTVLISVSDGGVADWEISNPQKSDKPFLEINGENEEDEARSLYQRMQEAAEILKIPEEKIAQIKKQLKAYLPIISDSRMTKDYLKFAFQ